MFLQSSNAYFYTKLKSFFYICFITEESQSHKKAMHSNLTIFKHHQHTLNENVSSRNAPDTAVKFQKKARQLTSGAQQRLRASILCSSLGSSMSLLDCCEPASPQSMCHLMNRLLLPALEKTPNSQNLPSWQQQMCYSQYNLQTSQKTVAQVQQS